ncbi:Obg family GTPase CgtA [Candidatus Magnetoovum chiemensis]|nr:Obg family GTPase CgtA [Candidatus Magnetoovum chiemensis]
MKFVDYVKVYVKAGDGGRGCVSFRREKFIPKGGPNGGNGGSGADIIIKADNRLNTLLDHKYNKHYRAQNGMPGMGNNMTGKDGEPLTIKVPVGTVIKDELTGDVIADLDTNDAEVTAAKGGQGGKGNAHFKSSTMQTPRFAQTGTEGQEAYLIFELKLIAQVGLIGMPNAGKSTLISSISSSKAKVADYPFTTLVPNLGVVKMDDFTSFTIADIPGIIENAHKGAGLGLTFLRHAERTSILLHLIDISDISQDDPVDLYNKILNELNMFSPLFTTKEQIVIGTKKDIAYNADRLKKLETFCINNNIPFYAVCALNKDGIKELLIYLSKRLNELKDKAA